MSGYICKARKIYVVKETMGSGFLFVVNWDGLVMVNGLNEAKKRE